MIYRTRSRHVMVLFVLLSTSCSNASTPTAPSPPPAGTATPPGSSPPTPAGTAVELNGVVRNERGEPVPGATVVLQLWPTQLSTTTGADGRYTVGGTSRPNSGCCVVSAVRAGYEKNVQYTPDPHATLDILLRDVIRITAGESQRLVIAPEDSLEGFDFELLARVVHVRAAVTGTVDLEVVSEEVGVPGGLLVGAGLSSGIEPTKLSVAMQANTEVAVRVLLRHWDYGAPRTFTLTTSAPSASRATGR